LPLKVHPVAVDCVKVCEMLWANALVPAVHASSMMSSPK
jgi:hypothetical protein